MTASKVGTSYLKLTIPLHILPSYFKNRTALCCGRFEYGLFTATSTLVVRGVIFPQTQDFRLRGVSPQTCGHGSSEGHKQILTLSIVKLFPITYCYYNTHF